MNINEIMKDFEAENREVELVNPQGKPTGWFFELRHESSEVVETFMREYRSKLQDAAMKRKTTAQKQLMRQHEDGLRIAHVAGWRFEEGFDPEDGRPPFSNRELKTVLTHEKWGWHIRDFIDREVGSLEDFLAKSQES
jgi:hypothetical protein